MNHNVKNFVVQSKNAQGIVKRNSHHLLSLKMVARFTNGVSIYRSSICKGTFHVHHKGGPGIILGINLSFREALEYSHKINQGE